MLFRLCIVYVCAPENPHAASPGRLSWHWSQPLEAQAFVTGEAAKGRVLHAAAVVYEAKTFTAVAVRVRNLGGAEVVSWMICGWVFVLAINMAVLSFEYTRWARITLRQSFTGQTKPSARGGIMGSGDGASKCVGGWTFL